MTGNCASEGLSLEVASATHQGLKRAVNADAFVIGEWGGLPRWCLLAAGVFDGAGPSGAEASSRAARYMQEGLASASWAFSEQGLTAFVQEVHRRLRADGRESGEALTTTAALAFLVRGYPPRLAIVSVGDSHASVAREGRVERLSPIDSVAEVLLDLGTITAGQAAVHPRRHALTQALGGKGDIAPHVRTVTVRAGDSFLLCTDGITNELDQKQIAAIMTDGGAKDICQALIGAANAAGGYDNSTAVVLQFRDIEPHFTHVAPALSTGGAVDAELSPGQWFLEVHDALMSKGEVVPLSGAARVGRSSADSQLDIVVPSEFPSVSRLHAVLVPGDSEVLLTDQSRFGTLVNGRRVHNSSVGLRQGDEVVFGLPHDGWRARVRKQEGAEDITTPADPMEVFFVRESPRQVQIGRVVVEEQLGDRAFTLLAYLASHKGEWYPIRHLEDVVWPDADSAPYQTQQALSRAKRTINDLLRPYLQGQDAIESRPFHGYRMKLRLDKDPTPRG